MDNLSLAWDTFEFHDQNIMKSEALHYENLKKFRQIRDEKLKLSKDDVKKFLDQMLKSMDVLCIDYQKQLSSLRDLVKIHSSGIEIPNHRQVEMSSLLALCSSISTLLAELNLYKLQIEFFYLDFS
jgi:hypothetical protein